MSSDRKYAKPVVVVSECLEFKACRYNGQMIPDKFVRKLGQYVTYVPVCPEVRIGLGVPRDPINIYLRGGKRQLVQPSTGKDVTADMISFSNSFLDSAEFADGFILKGRSPSCGIKDVKIRNPKDNSVLEKSAGFFGAAVMERFPHLAVEDEGRLTNFRIREHFLTKLFTTAEFRAISRKPSMRNLVAFQARNKLLFMAYNQTAMREMGRIVANHEKLDVDRVFASYSEQLGAMFAKAARYTSNINVLMHAFGYFSKVLKKGEKKYFIDLLEQYRTERVPLSVPLAVLRAWIVEYDEQYLADQTFFESYPPDLVEITDSGKGRDE